MDQRLGIRRFQNFVYCGVCQKKLEGHPGEWDACLFLPDKSFYLFCQEHFALENLKEEYKERS